MRVVNPCQADWNTMTGDDTRRWCAACGRTVVDVDQLDDAALAALRATGGCVRGRVDASGRLLRAVVVVGASVAAAFGSAATTSEPPPVPPAVPPVTVVPPPPEGVPASADELEQLRTLGYFW